MVSYKLGGTKCMMGERSEKRSTQPNGIPLTVVDLTIYTNDSVRSGH